MKKYIPINVCVSQYITKYIQTCYHFINFNLPQSTFTYVHQCFPSLISNSNKFPLYENKKIFPY